MFQLHYTSEKDNIFNWETIILKEQYSIALKWIYAFPSYCLWWSTFSRYFHLKFTVFINLALGKSLQNAFFYVSI